MSEDTPGTPSQNGNNGESFWSTLPGLLTAVAALITALGGILAILVTSGVIGPQAGVTPEAAATETPALVAVLPTVEQVVTATADQPAPPTATVPPAATATSAIKAVIAGQSRQATATPIEAAPPSEAETVQTPARPTFQVDNLLLLPIEIEIDGLPKGQVDAQSRKTFLLDAFPVSVGWDVIMQTTENGTSIGDAMGGIFSDVAAGDVITVDNVVSGQDFFYPVVSNLTADDCEVIVNRGWQSENAPGAVVAANSRAVELGYYKLFTNSNLTLDCPDSIFWWGLQPDERDATGFFEDVEAGTGRIEFTLEP